MTGKRVGLVVCFTAIFIQAGAQGLSIEGNGGLQGMHYRLLNGQSKPLPGGSLGLNYVFRLGSQWRLLTGIAGGIYRTQASLKDGLVLTYGQVDDAGSAFRYDVKFTGYRETQQFFAASIPLLLQYQTDGAGMQWYFDAGGKVFVPFNSSIQVSAQELSLSGYYPDYNLEVSNLPQHGFGTIKGWSGSSNVQLKPAAALSAATGISFSISPGTRLYTGVYLDYGLTDLKQKSDSMPLVTYSSAGIDNVHANSILNTQYAGPATAFSFGLQVRLSFGSGKTKHPAQPPISSTQTIPVPTPIPAARPAEKAAQPQSSTPDIDDSEVAIIETPILFGTIGETVIPDLQKPNLDQVADILKQHPGIRISITGHICNSSTETENAKVGIDRAKAVANYLHNNGIDRHRMEVSRTPQIDPVKTYDPAANYRNRRVVMMVE